MAKTTHSDQHGPETPATLAMLGLPMDFAIEAHGHVLTAADLAGAPVATLVYLISNGWTQSITDAAAFSKAEKEGKEEDEIDAMAEGKRDARAKAILAGTVGHRSGGVRPKGLDRIVRDVALERITAHMAANGKALPKGKGAAEATNGLIDNWLDLESKGERNPGKIALAVGTCREEATRRAEAAKAAGTTDGGDF